MRPDLDCNDAQILIIDDERSNLILLEGILRFNGYKNIELIQNPILALSTMPSRYNFNGLGNAS